MGNSSVDTASKAHKAIDMIHRYTCYNKAFVTYN